jgi:hypothetical protein
MPRREERGKLRAILKLAEASKRKPPPGLRPSWRMARKRRR